MNRNRTTRLGVESLEQRQLLAGNVSASVSGIDLNITGDNLANTITVESIGVGRVQVRGFGTSVNGFADGIRTFNVSGSINIRMNGGSDVVRVTNLIIRDNLHVDLGAGANELLLGQSQAGDNARFGGTPSGPLYVYDSFRVAGNIHNDRVFQSHFHVGGTGTVTLGDGNDVLQLDRPTGSGANVEYGGLFQVSMGAGADGISVNGLVVRDNMLVNDGGSNGNISINAMDVHGDLAITTANYSDSIGIQNTYVENVLTVRSQGGFDTITISAITERLAIDAGAGNDDVHVSQANVKVLNAFLGAGADQLDLLSDTTDRIFASGGDGDDLFLVRGTRAVDAIFNGDAGTDTYQESLLLLNNITNLHLNSIERRQQT